MPLDSIFHATVSRPSERLASKAPEVRSGTWHGTVRMQDLYVLCKERCEASFITCNDSHKTKEEFSALGTYKVFLPCSHESFLETSFCGSNFPSFCK